MSEERFSVTSLISRSKSACAIKATTAQALTLVFLFFNLALILLSVQLIDAINLTFAIILQLIPGLYLWAKINMGKKLFLSELLGMGLAIGTLLSIVSGSLFRTLPLSGFGWTAPFFLSILFMVRSRFFKNDLRISIKLNTISIGIRFYLLLIFLLSYLQIYVWARWNSIKSEGWWKLHLDVSYFESLSNSLAKFGTSNSFMEPDLETRYHWFAYGWVGVLNNSLKMDPFVVQTRLLPLVAMFMATTIIFSWARDFTENTWIAATASLLIVVGPGFAIGSLVMLRSPSSAMTAGWTLAFVLLLFRCLRDTHVSALSYVTLCLLSIGVVAGKGINILIVGAGIFLLLLGRIRVKRTLNLKDLKLFLFILISIIFSYIFLIYTPAERSLKLGIYIGWPALILTVLPLALGFGLKNFKKFEQQQDLLLFSLGAFLAGAILSLITNESAGGQLYFIISAVTFCIAPSLILIEKSLRQEKIISKNSMVKQNIQRGKFVGVTIALITAGVLASAIWIYFENRPYLMGDMGRASAPVVIWISATMLTLFLFWKKSAFIQSIRLKFVVLIVAISVISSSFGIFASLVRGPIYASNEGYVGFGKSIRENPGAISSNYLNAGSWVKTNINSDDRFFTNRQCLDPKSPYDDCLDIWFFASALSERQFLIEGGAYSVQDETYVKKMNEDQSTSLRFSLSPNLDDLNYLWSRGVRWGWIDKQVVQDTDWRAFATVVYNNQDIAIVKLADPKNNFKSSIEN